jgi:hypothetical protein
MTFQDSKDRISVKRRGQVYFSTSSLAQVECNLAESHCSYADIQDLSHQMKSLNTSDSTGGMRKSQRNWSAEHDNLKRGSVHEAPLISRTTDRGANVLLTAAGQHAMWQNITRRVIDPPLVKSSLETSPLI